MQSMPNQNEQQFQKLHQQQQQHQQHHQQQQQFQTTNNYAMNYANYQMDNQTNNLKQMSDDYYRKEPVLLKRGYITP